MHDQARNQLGTPGGAKSFLRGAQIFQAMSNTFFEGGEKNLRGSSPTMRPSGYGPVHDYYSVRKSSSVSLKRWKVALEYRF